MTTIRNYEPHAHHQQIEHGTCYWCHMVVPHGGNMGRLIADGGGTYDNMPSRYAYNNDKRNVGIVAFNPTYRDSSGEIDQSSCVSRGVPNEFNSSCTKSHGGSDTAAYNW